MIVQRQRMAPSDSNDRPPATPLSWAPPAAELDDVVVATAEAAEEAPALSGSDSTMEVALVGALELLDEVDAGTNVEVAVA